MSAYTMISRELKISAVFLMFVASSAWALTDDEKKEIINEANNFQYSTVTTKSGLRFRVPEDLPIETRNGIEAPLPFDEYMYSKFKKMDERMTHIEKTLDRIAETISPKPKEVPKSEEPQTFIAK